MFVIDIIVICIMGRLVNEINITKKGCCNKDNIFLLTFFKLVVRQQLDRNNVLQEQLCVK